MSYAEVYKMPLPKFLHMVRFLDPTGLLSLLQNTKPEGNDKTQTVTRKQGQKTLLPDLSTSEGKAEYDAMIDAAIAKGNVR